jgi:hypothetical protein
MMLVMPGGIRQKQNAAEWVFEMKMIMKILAPVRSGSWNGRNSFSIHSGARTSIRRLRISCHVWSRSWANARLIFVKSPGVPEFQMPHFGFSHSWSHRRCCFVYNS